MHVSFALTDCDLPNPTADLTDSEIDLCGPAYVGRMCLARALGAALDARDPMTAGHSVRVSRLAVAIGRRLGFTQEHLNELRMGALLHDIGKIGMPDELLRKTGRLTPEEYDAIKQHPTVGARILRAAPLLAAYVPVVELHHERPDGRGYPHGLRGPDIAVEAAIVHVADAFDAMTSPRSYRAARPVHEAVAELRQLRGTDFDHDAVDALVAVLAEARASREMRAVRDVEMSVPA